MLTIYILNHHDNYLCNTKSHVVLDNSDLMQPKKFCKFFMKILEIRYIENLTTLNTKTQDKSIKKVNRYHKNRGLPVSFIVKKMRNIKS